jgi:hypothetical protein
MPGQKLGVSKGFMEHQKVGKNPKKNEILSKEWPCWPKSELELEH